MRALPIPGSRRRRLRPRRTPRQLLELAATTLLVVACSAGPNGNALPPRSAGSASSGAASPGLIASGAVPEATPSVVRETSTPAPVPSAAPAPFDPKHVAVAFDQIASGFESPLAVVNAGDGSGRLFVVEQGGRVRIVRNGAVLPKPFLDIAGEISSGGERGLLGLAFHPGFPNDPRIFVDYTDTNGDTRVSSFTVDPATPDSVDPRTEHRLLFVKQPYPNHNGGALAFGPDGELYISLGDGGSGGDPQGNGQSLTTLLAKILRIDVDHPGNGRPYGIPTDNPYASGSGGRRPEIWLTGLRNPWRMSFDRATGDLWIGDVGQSAWEEIDVQRAGVPGGTNFGWNRMEGTHCYRPSNGCEDPALTLPVAEYGHDQGCTVIGGVVYRGSAQALLTGGYLFADYCSGRVWAIDASTNDVRTPTLVADTKHSFAAFGEDESGEVYAVDIAAGSLLEVTASDR
jgi:glucose/arabinose dehydrogenase